ncbi:MAG: signal peptide peptidase SppA [Tannerellaceae bacterium]
MKQFFKIMFASAFGFVLAAIVFTTLMVVAIIGIASAATSETDFTPKKNSVLRLKLSGTLKDNASEQNFMAQLFGETQQETGLNDMLKAIKNAKVNPHIAGIYIDAGAWGAGSASVESLRRALADFKESNKFIIAYGDTYTRNAFYLASMADKVYMNPQGSLQLEGIASSNMFYTGLLNKLGVQMQVFKVGTYKGAVEPFVLEKLSEANREQILSYSTNIWDYVIEGIASDREINPQIIVDYANTGSFMGPQNIAVEAGLVDELLYRPEVEDMIKMMAGQTDNTLKTISVAKAKLIKQSEKTYPDKIAILYAEGEIVEKTSENPLDNTSAITTDYVNELIKLKNDESIKAVVFRVNSPGGSAYVSEQIWRQVEELKKVKPIVVSMGDMAASGGYYISCAANKIIAEHNTLTGSIGIFGMFPDVQGLLDKVGITTDVVKTNTFSDFGDMSRPMNEAEKVILQSYINRGYDLFTTRVAEGRGKTMDEVNQIAQGRVWTGSQALGIGLVDDLGGIDKAVEEAAKLANLTNYNTTTVNTAKDFFMQFMDKSMESIKLGIAKDILGDEYQIFTLKNRIKANGYIQARAPYDINPL